MKCSIVIELLPKYIDGLCNGETNAEIRKHLDDCGDCRAVYEKMPKIIPREIPPENKNADFLKKLKAIVMQKKVIAATLICIAVLGGFYIYAKNQSIPVPFDPSHMAVKSYKTAIITNEYGYLSWMDVDIFKDLIPDDCEHVMDVVKLTYQGTNHLNVDIISRTINRNGRDIRVVYYCYTKTLWDRLWFVESYLEHIAHTERSVTYRNIYGDRYESADYEPQMIEIYYLPTKNLNQFDQLSDEEFDQLREQDAPIWSGIS